MSSLMTSLYTGASGIFVNQAGIQVTGNNISNINTTGYSREIATITSKSSLEQGGMLYGTGSTVDNISRVDTMFITRQLISQSSAFGEYDAASAPLADVEQILDISDSSLSADIDLFFTAWEALAENPSGSTERQQVLMEASDLAIHFQQIDQQMSEVVESINSEIESIIPDLNEMLNQIAALNQEIAQAEITGLDANTLRDQRDLLLQEVSENCGADSYVDNNGMVCLQLENGLPLVAGNTASSFSVERAGGLAEISLEAGGTTVSLDASDFGGALKGLLQVRDETIPELEDSIDRLAYEIATAVNSLHATGVDQNGDPGSDLFDLTPPTDPLAPAWDGAAASISVAFDDATLLAAGTSGLSGDNSLALAIGGLHHDTGVYDSTFNEEYARIAARVGLLVDANTGKLDSSTELLNETIINRDSVAGVSTDEEMLMLIQYQTGYEAASNFLSVVKEMLDTLMNL